MDYRIDYKQAASRNAFQKIAILLQLYLFKIRL